MPRRGVSRVHASLKKRKRPGRRGVPGRSGWSLGDDGLLTLLLDKGVSVNAKPLQQGRPGEAVGDDEIGIGNGGWPHQRPDSSNVGRPTTHAPAWAR